MTEPVAADDPSKNTPHSDTIKSRNNTSKAHFYCTGRKYVTYYEFMNTQNTPKRIALCAPGQDEIAFPSFSGVLEYKQRVEHWRLLANGESPIFQVRQIDLSQVDGVIGYIRDPQWAATLGQFRVQAVNISRAISGVTLPCVASDDEEVGRMGARHLLQRGFVQFGFVGYSDMGFSSHRMAGFKEALGDAPGRRLSEYSISLEELPDCASRIGEWVACQPRPLALMTANDHLGRQVIDGITQVGLRVPQDVAVLGVDNNKWQAQMAGTPLSSVEPNWRQIGYEAAKLLDGLLSGQAPPTQPVLIAPLGIATRQSTDIVAADDPIVSQALQFIYDRCHSALRVEHVLDHLGISRRKLEMHLRKQTGQTPQQAIFSAQVERAKRLLVETDASTYEVSQQCGFLRQDRFFIVFKRLAGMTPGQYRQWGKHR
ncbi:MAG: helix-turn-helix domain-containing protein [Phycisphaera sp.]|nr:helix-turn-helix domain-containing protein [Phycisphaera sp.]